MILNCFNHHSISYYLPWNLVHSLVCFCTVALLYTVLICCILSTAEVRHCQNTKHQKEKEKESELLNFDLLKWTCYLFIWKCCSSPSLLCGWLFNWKLRKSVIDNFCADVIFFFFCCCFLFYALLTWRLHCLLK